MKYSVKKPIPVQKPSKINTRICIKKKINEEKMIKFVKQFRFGNNKWNILKFKSKKRALKIQMYVNWLEFFLKNHNTRSWFSSKPILSGSMYSKQSFRQWYNRLYNTLNGVFTRKIHKRITCQCENIVFLYLSPICHTLSEKPFIPSRKFAKQTIIITAIEQRDWIGLI